MTTDKAALLAAINDSGLWATYGDAAPLLGYGNGRALAQANWDHASHTRLADRHGRTDAVDETRAEAWRASEEGQAALAVDRAFGYPHPEEEAKPPTLRLEPRELRMLAGLEPSDVALRNRVRGQQIALECHADESAADHPHYASLWAAVGRARALVRRLEANR